jgi:hypothetical protein
MQREIKKDLEHYEPNPVKFEGDLLCFQYLHQNKIKADWQPMG